MLDFKEIVVEKKDVGIRLDTLISNNVFEFTRNYAQKLILNGNVFLNNKVIKKSYKVKLNDLILVKFEKPKEFKLLKEDIPLQIVYEDDDILIVNKKRGMVVHPGNGNLNKTLVNALLWHCKENLSSIGGFLRPGIVHRIDKNTTGLLAVAKTNVAFNSLSAQIKNHSFKRVYCAIVHGNFKQEEGIINLPIGRNFKQRKKMAVNFKNGKNAITYFKVLKNYKNFSYVMLKLKTGRTHQIRVHLSHLNHPIAGDDLYGIKSDFKKYNLDKGQCLHAKELGIFHPTLKKNLEFSVEADEYFLNFLNRCEKDI